MKILSIDINNFRCFATFELQLRAESIFLIGENAAGKTTILESIALALGAGGKIGSADFRAEDKPIEIQLLLTDLAGNQRAHFADEIDFAHHPTTLTVGVRAVWDPGQETVDILHGYPRHGWKKSTRDQRGALLVEWLSEERDTNRLLQLGRRRNLMGKLLDTLSVEQTVDEAAQSITEARQHLSDAPDLQLLLDGAKSDFSNLIPDVSQEVFTLGSRDQTADELLSYLELYMAHSGPPVALTSQSSGLAQLAIFSFALQLVKKRPGTIVLVDEPEISLHPQAQRALLRMLMELRVQTILATHSASLLDRADPRRIARLFKKEGDSVAYASPATLSDDEAKRLARFSAPQIAEAFFARRVVLVEGESDKYALEAAAEKIGPNLDGKGISIVSLEGAGGLGMFLKLLGPRGFNIPLSGLCDSDEESTWASVLTAAGLGSDLERAEMERLGFFVCDADLEDELLRAAGEARAQQLIDQQGDGAAFNRFASQPQHRTKSSLQQLHDFISTRGRKVLYAPLLVDCLDLGQVPAPLTGVLDSVR